MNTANYTLLPDSRFKIYWNYVMLAGILYFAIKNPIYFAFHKVTDNGLLYADICLTLIFFADILMEGHTAFYREGELITNLAQIRYRYLKKWFIIDFLGTVPLDMAALAAGYVDLALYLSLFRLLWILRVFRLFSRISVILSYSSHVRAMLFVFWVIVSVNLCACGWILINPGDGSVDGVTFYNKAVYWVVTTLTTVGYGDIHPTSNIGRIYTMIVMMIGVGMYGFIIGNISTILVSANVPRAANREKMALIASYMKQYNIPLDLQESIFNYYNFGMQQNVSDNFSRVISELPTELSSELKDHVNIHLVTQVPLFRNADRDSLKEIIRCFRTEIFSPSETIIQSGEEGNEMYFLVYGIVEVISDQGKVLNKLRTGSFFGELALLRKIKRIATVRALTYCQVYRLNNEDLERIMKKYPPLKRQLEHIAKKRYVHKDD